MQTIWKQLYTSKSARDVGTMYHIRQKFGKKNVYADAKKNFKASAELLQEVTKSYVCEAFMEWAGMDDMDEEPLNIEIPHANTNHLVKKRFMESVIGNFVDKFILPDLNAEKALKLKKEGPPKAPVGN